MKMNNRGFTLIELLAVFVILISVSFVAVGGITASLEKQDKRECENQMELVISAAKMYFSLDGKGVDQVNGVTVDTLISKGYVEDEEVSSLKSGGIVKLDGNIYKYVGDCK